MRDRRLAHFETTLDALTDSLDATARIRRWQGPEAIPEPLEQSAAKLLDRLGAANRLTTGRLTGPADVVARLTRMVVAIRKLDAAYVEFLQCEKNTPDARSQALVMLDEEIQSAKAAARA
jgi:hypothetical protein